MLPLKYVRDAKDDYTGDYIKEIAGGKDTHQVVEIVPLGSEPDDEVDVANNTKNTKHDLVDGGLVQEVLTIIFRAGICIYLEDLDNVI